MKYLTILIIVFLSSICYADGFLDNNELTIGYSPWCYHLNRPSEGKDINEDPNGIAVIVNKWTVLTFENSNFNRSWFIGRVFQLKEWTPYKNYYAKLNLYGGILHGYETDLNITGWIIAAVPTIEIGRNNISLEAMLNPIDGGITALMIKYKF